MADRIRFTVHRLALIAMILISTVGCDQITKVIARDTLHQPYSYLHNSVRLVRAQNPGSFLSLGADLSPQARFWIFDVTNLLILLAVGWLMFRKKDGATTIGLALVLAGGVGNLIDRLVYGSVTDFLTIGVGRLSTGIFNIADMAVVAGVLILVFNRNTPPKSRLGRGR